jgi:hypothetical protein
MTSFVDRTNLLPNHFLAEHSELNGIIIRLPSATLRPSWQPFPPSISSPPEFPEVFQLGSILVTPTACSAVRKKTFQPFPPSPTPSQPLSPRKQQRQILLQREVAPAPGDNGLQVPEFGTLPKYDQSTHPQDLIIWHRPRAFDMDVSRPQHAFDLQVNDAPLSILYEVFAKQVDEIERKMCKTI